MLKLTLKQVYPFKDFRPDVYSSMAGNVGVARKFQRYKINGATIFLMLTNSTGRRENVEVKKPILEIYFHV